MASPMAEQHWNPTQYARDAGFVAALGEPLLAVLAPQPGERILDLGCGDGALTSKLVEAGAQVVGVDASAEQVAAARALGIDARTVSGEALAFDRAFDAVFSNAALHWMKRPERVIAGVARALVPGGRFVGEFGGAGNVEAIRAALWAALSRRGVEPSAHDPWYFPEPAAYRALLEQAGFVVDEISSFPRPTPLPGEVDAWIAMFGQAFTNALPEAERAACVREVRDAVVPVLQKPDGSWTADYVRVRFAARLLRAP